MKTSEDLFHSIVETASDAIVATDSGGKIIFWNRAAGTLFDYSAEEMKNKHLTDLMPERFRESHGKALSRAFSTGQSDLAGKTIELSGCRRNGTEFPLELSLSPWKSGEEVFFTATIRDVTKRKPVEEALRDSQQMLQIVLDSIPSAVFWKDRDSIYLGGNRIWLEGIGLKSSDEVVGKSDFDLPWKKKQADSFREYDRKVIDSGIPEYDIIESYLRADGTHAWARTNKVPLHDTEGNVVGILGTYEDITEHKRAEEALRESEEHYRELVEKAGIAIVIDDQEGNIVYFNNEFVKIFGYSPDEIKQHSIRSFVHPDDMEMVASYHQARLRGKEAPTRYEFRGIKKDGTTVFLEVDVVCLREGRSIIGTRSYLWDITERKRAEEALQESEEKHRTLFEQSPIGITTLDMKGVITSCSPAVYTEGGYTENELIGKHFSKIAPLRVRDIPKFLKVFSSIMGGKVPDPFEVAYQRRDGAIGWTEIQTALMKAGDKKLGVQVLQRDITERKRAEEALKESEEHYRELSDSITDVFFAFDKDLKYTYWNKASEKLTGNSAEDAIGKSLFDLFPDTPQIRKAEKVYLDVLKTQQPRTFVNEYRLGGKNYFFEISAYPSEEGLSVFTKDITERKQAEEALKDSEAKHRNILESIEEGYFEVDLAGNLTFFNDSLCRMVGFSRSELMGMNNREYTSLETAKKIYEAFNEMYRTGKSLKLTDYKVVRADGNTRVLEMSASLMRDPSGEPIGFRGVVRDTTERKRAEEALRESERNLIKGQEIAQMGYWKLNIVTEEVEGSDELLRIFGLGRDEMTLNAFAGVVHPEDREYDLEHIQKGIEKGVPWDIEHRLLFKDGTIKWIRAVGEPNLDESGKTIHIMGIVQDITERKRAEKERERLLYDMEERLKELNCMYSVATSIRKRETLEDILRDVVAFIPPAWQYPEITRSRLRFNEAEYVSEPFEKTGCKQSSDIVAGGERRGTVEVYYLESRPERDEGPFLKEERQLLDGITSALGELIERKHAEEALWSSREYSQNIVDSSLDMIIAVDNRRRITAFNTAATDTFGYESEEALGKHVNLLYADPKEGLRVHKETVKHGHHIQEILNRRKNGELFPCLLSASVLSDADGNKVGVMGVSRDITERKQAEDKLRQYASDLERSNKELQQFAHAVSHDLQEPLRTIRSYLQLLAERYQQQLDADADTFITYAVEGVNRMRELIRGLLTYSQVETQAQDFKPANCDEVLGNTLANLQVTIKETQAQVTHDPLPTVMADGPQMGQLLQNLIENAIKFRKEEPPCVHISSREERDHWLFSVRDNGIGIDPGQSERIFEIFQRLVPRKEYPGTGIGLTICKKIVERHGGKIWVESTPGKGSTFYFTIVK